MAKNNGGDQIRAAEANPNLKNPPVNQTTYQQG
jgi:hypothetical protein